MASENSPLLSSSASSVAETQISKTKFIILLLSLYFGVFIAAVDSTVTSTLMANIASDLNALENISWVATAYLVAYSALQPLYGKLSDIFGRKRVLLFATFIFGLGCYVCTLGNTITPVIIGRLLNGVGAGGMLSLSSITVSDYVPSRKRGVYQGFGNIAFSSGAAAGGIIGSAAQAYKGWRFAFTVQVPLALLSMIIVTVIMEDKPKNDEVLVADSIAADHVVRRSSFERLDLVGSFSLAGSVSTFMMGVTTGGTQFPWQSWQIALLFSLSVGLFALFFYWEKNVAIEPVLPISLISDRTILGTCFTNFFCSGTVYTYLFYAPIYFTAVFDYEPKDISQRIVSNFIGVAIGSLGSGLIMQKTGKYYVLSLVSTVGVVFGDFLFLANPYLPRWVADTWWYQDLSFMLLGLFYAAMLTISLVTLINAVPKAQATATSAQYTFRGAGSSVGVAMSAALFNHVLGLNLHKRVTGEGAAKVIKEVSRSVAAIHDIPKQFVGAVVESYKLASVAVFILTIGLSLGAVVSSAVVEEHELNNK